MLTPRGRTVLALAVGLAAAGRVLALRELSVLGAMLGVLLATGFGTILVRRLMLSVSRDVSPTRTSVGADVTVELTITNRGTLGGGPLLLEDALPPGLALPASLTLPSLGPRMERRIAYTLRPLRRGVFRIGPLDLMLTDPFGLFLRRQPLPGEAGARRPEPEHRVFSAHRPAPKWDGSSAVVVYPAFERITTMPRDVQRAGVVRRSPLLGTGDEFYALRGYQQGDDLRKVHWPSSLRLGELLIRQEELLQQAGALLVLDTCAAKHRGEGARSSIEAAISACASVATLAISAGMSVEIVAGGGPLLKVRRPTTDEVLEGLALLEPANVPDLGPAMIRTASRRPTYTTIVVITPGLSEREAAILADAASRAAGGVTVHVAAQTFAADGHASRRPRFPAVLAKLGLPMVSLRASDSFHDIWEAGVRGVALAR